MDNTDGPNYIYITWTKSNPSYNELEFPFKVVTSSK